MPVAEAGRRARIDWETGAAKRLLTWVGAGVLFLGFAFFLKYAFDRGWLGPRSQVVLGIAAGAAMLIGGDRSVRRGMRILGQGLMGGGLAVLYASLFAGFRFWGLIPQPAAFAGMVVVTVVGATLAVRHNGLSVSIMALVGGMLTPVLVSTGEDSRDILFSYLTLLDMGMIGVLMLRRWRVLDTLAFCGTWLLFAGWHLDFYAPAAVRPVLAWVGVFFLLFLLLPAVRNLRQGLHIPVERWAIALANGAVAYLFARDMLGPSRQLALAYWTLGMGACYAAMAVLVQRRVPGDVRPLQALVSAAVVALTLALYHGCEGHAVLVAWSVEAPALLYVGYRLRYPPVQQMGIGVLLLAVIRLFFVHWPIHAVAFTPVLNTAFASAMCVPLAVAACAALSYKLAIARADGTGRRFVPALGCFAGLLALVLVHAELALYLEHVRGYSGMRLEQASQSGAALLWVAGAAAFAVSGLAARSKAVRLVGYVPAVVAAVLVARLYGLYLPGRMLFLNSRFGIGLLVTLVFVAYPLFHTLAGGRSSEKHSRTAGLLAVPAVLLLILLSIESHHYCVDNIEGESGRQSAQMAVSIVWGVYAAACVVIGFWRDCRWLRLGALGLFGLTAAKVILVDMCGVEQVYRIITFIALGLLMIGASYVYHRVEKGLSVAADLEGEQRETG
jgi:uncharacterized membrane protein